MPKITAPQNRIMLTVMSAYPQPLIPLPYQYIIVIISSRPGASPGRRTHAAVSLPPGGRDLGPLTSGRWTCGYPEGRRVHISVQADYRTVKRPTMPSAHGRGPARVPVGSPGAGGEGERPGAHPGRSRVAEEPQGRAGEGRPR